MFCLGYSILNQLKCHGRVVLCVEIGFPQADKSHSSHTVIWKKGGEVFMLVIWKINATDRVV